VSSSVAHASHAVCHRLDLHRSARVVLSTSIGVYVLFESEYDFPSVGFLIYPVSSVL